MFKNFIVSALRNLKRHKVFSVINIFGLAGSMAVFILITIYVRLIAGTDKFHENADRIYRVERPRIHNMAAPIGPFLKEQYPEVEAFIRTCELPVTGGLIKYDEKTIRLQSIWLADSSFFTAFTFPLKIGDANEVLSKPNAIVLSETTAKRIFGEANPIGLSVLGENRFTLEVTGVMEDFPVNSSIQADAIISFDFNKIMRNNPKALDNFFQWNYNTLLLMKSGVDVKSFEEKMNVDLIELIKRNIEIPKEEEPVFVLTPLTDIYFNTYKNNDDFQHGSRSNITIAIGVSLIILLLAVINFTNLSTAQATYRTKEIGIRKTLGANRPSLIKQHLSESVLTAYISILIAILAVEQLIHVFSSMVNVTLSFQLFDKFNLAVILLGPLALGILGGSYPAFFTSSFSPQTILSGMQSSGKNGAIFRKILIVAQFTAASILIIFTLHVNRQVNYLNNRNLGIDKENKIFIETSPEMLKNREVFMNELKSNPIIYNASLHVSPIGVINEGWGMDYEGKRMNYRVQQADSNYFSTLGIDILQGRIFKNYEASDSVYEVVINKRAVELYELNDPVGIIIPFMKNTHLRIVGVISDFHYESLHKPIEPLMVVNRVYPQLATISYQSGKTQETIQFLENLWGKYSPNSPITYRILSDDIKNLYSEEARLKNLFRGFTVVAIFIACIGLFGLATFDIGKRIREIGIRKVLGSTSAMVVSFITWQFLRTIVISMVVAFPISYWLIKKWLQNFITPAGHSIWLYIGSGALVMGIALATVIYHSVRAANTNPASVLKYE